MKFLRKSPEIGVFCNFHMLRCFKKNSALANSTKYLMITMGTVDIQIMIKNTRVIRGFFEKILKMSKK